MALLVYNYRSTMYDSWSDTVVQLYSNKINYCTILFRGSLPRGARAASHRKALEPDTIMGIHSYT